EHGFKDFERRCVNIDLSMWPLCWPMVQKRRLQDRPGARSARVKVKGLKAEEAGWGSNKSGHTKNCSRMEGYSWGQKVVRGIKLEKG
ncbi:hypothetical protein Tco_0126501, partial [Tanacetum coccineum]